MPRLLRVLRRLGFIEVSGELRADTLLVSTGRELRIEQRAYQYTLNASVHQGIEQPQRIAAAPATGVVSSIRENHGFSGGVCRGVDRHLHGIFQTCEGFLESFAVLPPDGRNFLGQRHSRLPLFA